MTILLLISATVSTFATDVSGLISSDTVWTFANNPYIVTGNILVNNGVTLTIESGVIVKFNSGLSMQIDGTLIAQGTSSDSITFTSNTVDTAGAWGYIYFSDTSTDAVFQNDINGIYLSGSILEYCIIQYAGGISVFDNGALRLDQATPFINYCTITNNSASGIRVYEISGGLKISNSVITNNASLENGGGIYIINDQWDGIPTTSLISGNTISYNSTVYPYSTSEGGGIYIAVGNYKIITISNNIVTNNTADNGGGIYNAYHGTAYISNNIIINNTSDAGGAGIYNGKADGTISENIISNNTSLVNGGGIMLFQGISSVIILNNVIADNVTSSSAGGIYSWSSPPTILNNHIVRNTANNDVGIYYYSCYYDSIRFNTIAYNKNTDYGNNFNRTLYLTLAYPEIKNNNIFNNDAFYELYNDNYQGTPNVAATNNWWGTANDVDIQAKIYDWFDDSNLGIVNYSPYLTTPDTAAPVSPPANVTKTNIGGGQVQLTWEHNPETDIAGYFVYFGNFNGYEFTNSVNIGNDTIYILTGVSIFDTIAVTAYDSTYNLVNENVSTITNDNMTNGNESWFTYAESECSTITLAMSAVDASCSTCNDGTATATVSLGLEPYTYSWNTVPIQTTSTATDLLPGTYYVTVTDNNGCVLTDSVVVSFPIFIKDEINPSSITIYPNPASNIITLCFNTNSNDVLLLNIYNIMGSLIKTEILLQNQQDINISALNNGIYMIEVKTKKMTEKQKLIIQR